MSSYTVTFTTRRYVSTYDEQGNKTGETVEHKPQKITGLPYSTAVGYKDRDNFEFEREIVEARRTLPRPNSSGFDAQLSKARKVASKRKKALSSLHNAAAAGDLSHALRSE